jgi:hypothetical protein
MQSANISWHMLVGDDRTDDNAYGLLCRTKHHMKAYKEHNSSTLMSNNTGSVPLFGCLAVKNSLQQTSTRCFTHS